ncbi:MAG: CPBP family intramembrane metalloprotease [Sphingobacteriales bacterium]|nr:MAG: CPBP family intramembrane metalloprotease [Sphingobacteriales bacterium]
MNRLRFEANIKPYRIQFLYLLLLLLISYFFFSVLQVFILMLAGYNLESIQNLVENLGPQNIGLLKALQLVTTIGVFIVPAILFSYLKSGKAGGYLPLGLPLSSKAVLLAAMVTISALPLMAFFMELNQSVSLPSFLKGIEQWMREMEGNAEKLTLAFLKMDTPLDLMLNIVIIALLPALGEELLFRGCLQQLFTEWTKRPHLSIMLAAAIFSAFHFQFLGFVPRMLIGAFLGYLFYWSGNLWYAIIGHFVNNALQVVGYYFTQGSNTGSTLKAMDSLPTSSILLGTAIFSGTLYLFYKNFNRLKTSPEILELNRFD